MRRPSCAELAAARDRTVPDVVAPGLRVLFCGINPGLYSGALGEHFARPGNRFWRVLAGAGITPRLLRPDEQLTLPSFGIGITNLVGRTTATAAELSADELRDGAIRVGRLVEQLAPGVLAVLGVQAYRTAFGRRAVIGRQEETLGSTTVWVLPNPSGAQARYQLAEMVGLFAVMWQAASPAPSGAVGRRARPPGELGTGDSTLDLRRGARGS